MLKVMYAITKQSRKAKNALIAMRTLADANQGRNHFDDKAKAEAHLAAIKNNTDAKTLEMVYGDPKTLRVDPIFCYDHGDALGIYVDENPLMDEFEMRHMVKWINEHVPEHHREEKGEVSQAGFVHRFCALCEDLPKDQWDWRELRAKAEGLYK